MSVFSQDVLVDNTVTVDGSGVTQPVSAVSLPLPTGAATASNQSTANTSLSSIDTKTPALVGGRQPVDGSGVTQPVSGTFWPATQPVSGTVSISGTVATTSALSNTATITQVTATTTNSTLLAANANRKKAILFIAGMNALIKFGAVASASSFTYKVASANTTIEITGWTGQLDVIMTGGNSLITVTELV